MNWMSDSLSSSLKGYKLGPLGSLANRVPVRGGILSLYGLEATSCSFRGSTRGILSAKGSLVNVEIRGQF